VPVLVLEAADPRLLKANGRIPNSICARRLSGELVSTLLS
jgi:hypothetical protein